jgi:hypothetical protein
MDLSKGTMRGLVAVILCGALWVTACGEQKATESAAPETASKLAAPVPKQPVEPPRADARAKAPPDPLARLDYQLRDVTWRIGQLEEGPQAPDGETLQELNDELSRIAKEREELRTAAGEQWEAARDRLYKALEQLKKRLARLENSESPT